MDRRPRIAYFSPLPPARTGIADYSQELLPPLARLAEVTLFAEHPDEVAAGWTPSLPVSPLEAYAARRWDFDAALFHLGNSRFHGRLYEVFRQYPGIVVLHDYGLHELFASQTIGQARFWPYLREMGYALGARGLGWARDVRDGRCPLPHFEVPLNDRILDTSLGIIVHSRYVQQLIAQHGTTCPVTVVPAPIASVTANSRRAELDWPPDAVVFGSFGMVAHAKQIARALHAFRELLADEPLARYLIVGDWAGSGIDLPGLIEQLGLGHAVRHTGFVANLPGFLQWIASVDVVVNLRAPTVGETSATALRALAAGRPLVVLDHGWYSELPDDVCVKVPPADDAALLAALRSLATDASLRQGMGGRAGEYAAAVHAPATAAEAYVAFIERVLARSRPALAAGAA